MPVIVSRGFEGKYLIVVGASCGEVRVDATNALLRALFG
jgi:hypothetical protein